MNFVVGFLTAVLVAVIAGIAVMLTGGFNVAATDPHAPIVRWVLDTTFHRHVERQAETVGQPPAVTEALLAKGFTEYDQACVHCHGAPGVPRQGWSDNMRPKPPDMARAAADWSEQEIFWIARHGVKMTGMPAFGPTHSDETLWAVAHFVKDLPDMDAETYRLLRRQHGRDDGLTHGG